MLVLSRKATEGLRIGDDVEVRVVRVAGNRVTLGIVAPQETRIVRFELPALQVQPEQPQQHKAA